MYFDNYIKKVSAKSSSLATSIAENTANFTALFDTNFDFTTHKNALFMGNVQSGKTAQILGVISKIAEKDIPFFIFLTTDNVYLHKQTFERICDSFDFTINCNEYDDIKFLSWDFQKPLILVLKKNTNILKKWKNLIGGKSELLGRPIVIIDDEADASSLNTLVNRNKISTINNHLTEIKKLFNSSLYIELTATPQSVLLQSSLSGWKPDFVFYFPPGEGYVGGNLLFSIPKPYSIEYTKEFEFDEITKSGAILPEGLRNAILNYLIVVGHFKYSGQSTCNFLIHPSVRIAHHESFAEQIGEALNEFIYAINDPLEYASLAEDLKLVWSKLQVTQPDITPIEDILQQINQILNEVLIKIIVLNSNTPIDVDYNSGYNIIVGGNSLGRGITIPNLQIVYYCRKAKKIQADTYWQHSRIFGYDRVRGLIRVFIPPTLYKIFSGINDSNNILINQIKEKGIDGIQIVLPDNILPTRKNVIANKFINVLSGGVNYFPNYPYEYNATTVDPLLISYGEGLHDITIDFLLEIFDSLGEYTLEDWDKLKFINSVLAFQQRRPNINVKLIIGRDRNISKGTGTLLSPNDRKAGDSFESEIVLTLYRINGKVENNWNGAPFWIPNIKFPSDFVIYDMIDED